MIRRIVPALAVAALLGACASNTASTPEPGAPTTSRSAETRGAGEGRGGRGGAARDEMLFRGITLSSDQQQQIETIRARYRSQMEAARQQGNVDRGAMRETMQKQQAEIRAVLNPDQQAQYDRNMAEMRSRMQQGGDRRPNG